MKCDEHIFSYLIYLLWLIASIDSLIFEAFQITVYCSVSSDSLHAQLSNKTRSCGRCEIEVPVMVQCLFIKLKFVSEFRFAIEDFVFISDYYSLQLFVFFKPFQQ